MGGGRRDILSRHLLVLEDDGAGGPFKPPVAVKKVEDLAFVQCDLDALSALELTRRQQLEELKSTLTNAHGLGW